jgi:hypothetical protein
MQRIRIKKAPNKGDQRDYSLYDRTSLNPGAPDNTEHIGTTMGPVDREDANVEVERGEVVIGDTNQDGFLELFTFTGKPHSKGGTPVNIPPGSFIYSNTRKLRIKDAELLKSQFGLSMKKGGWTPAEIANKFQINEYVSDLKNPDTDNLTKRSSDRMLKNNLQKLGILALIQESMKGFPDGIPAIAEPVMQEMGVDPSIITGQQPQEQAPQLQEAPEQEVQEQPQEAPAEESGEGMPSLEEFQAMQEQGMQKYGGLTQYAGGGMTVQQAQALSKNLIAKYQDAYKRKDYAALATLAPQLRQASNQINQFNDAGWYSLGMIPGTDQSAFNSYTSQLSQAANDIERNIIPQSNFVSTIGNQLKTLTDQYQADYNKLNSGQLTNLSTEDMQKIKQIYELNNRFAAHAANIKAGGAGMPVSELARLQNQLAKYSAPSSTGDNGMSSTLDSAEVLNAESSAPASTNTYTSSPFKKGDVYKSKWGSYEIVNPAADADGMIQLVNKQNNAKTKVKLSTMQQAIGTGLTKGGADLISTAPAETPAQPPAQPRVGSTTTPSQGTQTTPAASSGRSSQGPSSATTGPMFSDDIYKMRYGGYLKRFDGAGTNNVPLNTNATTPATDEEKFVSDVSVNGQTYKKYSKGDLVIIKDANGRTLSSKNIKTGEKTDYRPDATITYNAKNERINIDAPDPSVDYKAKDWKGKYSASADEFEKLINDPGNEDLRNSIYEEFKKIAQDHAARTGDKSLLNIDKANAIQMLIKGNRDNATINSVYEKNPELLKSGDWDKTQPNDYVDAAGNKVSGKNLIYNRVASKLGITPMDALGTKVFQGIYQASQNVARQPQYVEKFTKSGFDITPIGLSDQTRLNQPISPVDEIYGNTTVGQMYKLKQDPEIPITVPPGKKVKYYCVKQANGMGNVVSVTYNEGEQPIAPAGAGAGFDDRSTAAMNCSQEQPGLEQAPVKSGPWWLPDIVNYTGTLTDKINRYEPTLEQLSSRTPGYVLLDPTRQLAANQSQMQQYNDMLSNTMAGNVAAATALGASGEGFNNAANVLASVEGQNVGIVNNVAASNAQIQNQQDMLNAQARQNYVGQMATLNQNLDNAEQQRKWRQIAAFNNGTNNWYRKKQMEQVLFPQVFINPISGDAEFSGKGRDYAGYDVYSPAYASNTKANTFDVQGTYNKYIKAGNTDAQAKWLTEKELELNKTSSSGSDASSRQAYMNAIMNQSAGQAIERWGGAITPWDFDV